MTDRASPPFRDWEIRALLREIEAPGTGKTQTRRLLKPQPPEESEFQGFSAYGSALFYGWGGWINLPYQPGSRLWLRETCRAVELDSGLDGVSFSADNEFVPIQNTQQASQDWLDLYHYRQKRDAVVPSIHMPRWASRITLIVSDVRVQRLLDISEEDAKAEGVERLVMDDDGAFYQMDCGTYRTGFAGTWEHLNARRGHDWDANPWVAAVTFRPVLGNIDAISEAA